VRSRSLSIIVSIALTVPAAAGVLEASSRPAGASVVSNSPSWTYHGTSNWDRSSSPTIADVNGDGTPDIVIGNQDGWLRVINGATGGDMPGWPQPAVVSGVPAAIDSTPAVGDLFKDGRKEIVVGVGSTWAPNQNGGVIVFNPNGSKHCVFHTRDFGNIWANTGVPDGYTEAVFSSPAIGDVNGDGYPDIVFGGFDQRIYAIDRNCNAFINYNIEDTIWSSPALYDVDGDGRMEIFIGGDQYAGGAIDWSGGEFRALKWNPFAPGGAVELWKRQINDTVWSSPAIGDIDNDGRLEAVVGGGSYYNRIDGRRIWAWHLDDGSPVPGWPVTFGGNTMSAPALGDLTGDGVPEVVAASSDGFVTALRGNGTTLWNKHLLFSTSPGGPVASPIIADMDGDGRNDVGAGNNWGYFVLNGGNGTIMQEVNTWHSYESAGAVGHFADGWKLVVDGFDQPHHTHRLQAFDMPAPGTTPPWPMFRGDPLHHAGPIGKNLLAPGYCRHPSGITSAPNPSSNNGYWEVTADGSVYALNGAPYHGGAKGHMWGQAAGIGASPSGNGYYVVSNVGEVIPFGDAVSYGNLIGKRLNKPIIGLAPTPSGHGYWLLGQDGGIFTFGDARFYGSLGSKVLNAPIISMAATVGGHGYWLLGADGGVFTFGDARFRGSTGGMNLNTYVMAMAASHDGNGYWLMALDGRVFNFNVPAYGGVPGLGMCRPPNGVRIRTTATGSGYFVLGNNGGVYPFGDAKAGTNPTVAPLNFPVDLALRP
jgi:hypothetical protein